jgi:hypothetical protein
MLGGLDGWAFCHHPSRSVQSSILAESLMIKCLRKYKRIKEKEEYKQTNQRT